MAELYYVAVYDNAEKKGNKPRLLNKDLYKRIENAFNDVATTNSELFGDDITYRIGEEFPVFYGATGTTTLDNGEEIADDFKFEFKTAKIIVEVGTIMTMD